MPHHLFILFKPVFAIVEDMPFVCLWVINSNTISISVNGDTRSRLIEGEIDIYLKIDALEFSGHCTVLIYTSN